MRRKVVESLISRLILLISAGVVLGGCDDTMTAEPTPMSEGDSNRKIIGGSGTNIESVPWQVAISFVADPTDHIWCGGSIISPDWILTAAHCLDTVENAADLKVRAGITNLDETGGQIRHASEYIVHSDYDSELLFNDIALIKLDAPLDLTGSKAKAIQLATNTDLAAFAPNEEGLVSGWGYARYGDQQYLPNTLQSVKIPIQPNPMSFLIYETLEYPILDSMFSAGIWEVGGVDTCNGDSGGSFVVSSQRGPLLAGIPSWGMGCADAYYPGVYTKVAYYTDWIADNTSNRLPYLHWLVDSNRDGNADMDIEFGLAYDAPMTGDFNKDGVADLVLLRRTGTKWRWYIDTDRDGYSNIRKIFGKYTDTPVIGDYDGDGRSDLALVRYVLGEGDELQDKIGNGKWQWIVDTNLDGKADLTRKFGHYTDRPVPGKYNDDNATDFAVLSRTGQTLRWKVDTNKDGIADIETTFGYTSNWVVPADYSGDGITDFGIIVPFEGARIWAIDTNHDGTADGGKVFGYANTPDVPMPANYDGIAGAEPGQISNVNGQLLWQVANGQSVDSQIFGLSTDYAMTADFNGDKAADFVLIRTVD